jgi:hypothetical protein
MDFVHSAFLFRLVERGIFCTSYIVDFEIVVVGLLRPPKLLVANWTVKEPQVAGIGFWDLEPGFY